MNGFIPKKSTIYLNEWVDLCLLFRFENSLKKHRTYDAEPFNYATRIKSNVYESVRVCVSVVLFFSSWSVSFVHLFAENIKWRLYMIVSANAHEAYMTCGYGQMRDIVFKILGMAPFTMRCATWRTTSICWYYYVWITNGWKQDNPIFNKFPTNSTPFFF